VVEHYRSLDFNLRFGQSTLTSAEQSHRRVRHRAVRIALDGFDEQLFGTR
jgi:hypothetical protein